jgi:hypothetical protein
MKRNNILDTVLEYAAAIVVGLALGFIMGLFCYTIY